MNAEEIVQHLAVIEGRKLKPKQKADDVTLGVPYFHIEIDHRFKNVEIGLGAYKGHDNQDRMLFFAEYLMKRILPTIPNIASLQGFFSMELHDTYSYLNNGVDYTGCLTWSKRKSDHNVVLLPDLYQIVNYGGKLQNHLDTYAWESKNNKIGFWGTTTGSRNPKENERIQTCLWAHEHAADVTEFKITKVAQMTHEQVLHDLPNFEKVYNAEGQVSQDHMFGYKFLLDIPGNTCSWDRVPLIMSSNSLLFKKPCKDMCFYYPLMIDRTHYVEVNEHNMLNMREYYLNNPREAAFIIQNANHFAKTFFNNRVAEIYTRSLFQSCADHHGA